MGERFGMAQQDPESGELKIVHKNMDERKFRLLTIEERKRLNKEKLVGNLRKDVGLKDLDYLRPDSASVLTGLSEKKEKKEKKRKKIFGKRRKKKGLLNLFK